MSVGKIRQRRLKAFNFAATACAVRIAGRVDVGPINLGVDYRSEKLAEIGDVLALDQGKISDLAALVLNWGILAQRKIGAPPDAFADEQMVEFPDTRDPIGARLMLQHWLIIETLAKALLEKGRLSNPRLSQFLIVIISHRNWTCAPKHDPQCWHSWALVSPVSHAFPISNRSCHTIAVRGRRVAGRRYPDAYFQGWSSSSLRARSSILSISEALIQHASYFDAGARG